MSTGSHSPSPTTGGSRLLIAGVAVAVLLAGGIALDTTVVRIGSEADTRKQGFSAEAYGAEQFPGVQASIEERAVEAVTLFEAIAADKEAATAQYGVAGSTGPIFPVKFSGVVGEGKSGVYTIAVPGLPEELRVRVQTGPAINGTELRDATGTISFGQFTNQIEYQNAGSALNNEMKASVLSTIDNSALTGKTLTVTGAFRLVNPKSWLVTPVRLAVE